MKEEDGRKGVTHFSNSALEPNREKEMEALRSYSCQEQRKSDDMKTRTESDISECLFVLLILTLEQNDSGQKRDYVTLRTTEWFEQISWIYMVFSLFNY